MRKLDFGLGENKGSDQLCSNCTADQRLGFRYMESTVLLLLISKISSFYLSSMTAQPDLSWTWSETTKSVFSCHDSNLNYAL